VVKVGWVVSLAVVRDLRERRELAGPEELAEFETDVLAGFVLARASVGLLDSSIRADVVRLEHVRAWFGRPLWEMEPGDADAYFGRVLRGSPKSSRATRASSLSVFGAAAQG
jgi:integrase/recombinase XerD